MTLMDAVSGSATRDPGACAVRDAHDAWTYQRVLDQAEDWSSRLRNLFPTSASLVAIVTAGNIQLPSLILGVRLAGHVPLLIDRLQQRSRTEPILDVARPSLVVDLDHEASVHPRERPRSLRPEIGYVTFSSGSQGRPKGILGNEAGLVEFLSWQSGRTQLSPTDAVAALTSPSFDVSYRDLFLPLVSGSTLVIPPTVVRAGQRVPSWLDEQRVSAVHLVPSLSTMWTRADPTAVPRLRWSMFAGEPLHSQHVERWTKAAPLSRVLNLYGPAETTLASFHQEVLAPVPSGQQPVGTAIPGRELVPLEPLEQPGEFRVGIAYANMAYGYLDTTATEEHDRFMTLPDGRRVFRTDDRGEIDRDGKLILKGRLGSLVKRRGTLIDLSRIERTALEWPDTVEVCAIQAVGDPLGQITLFACSTDSDAGAGLRQHLRAGLSSDAPDHVVLVRALPKLPSGKLDRQALLATL